MCFHLQQVIVLCKLLFVHLPILCLGYWRIVPESGVNAYPLLRRETLLRTKGLKAGDCQLIEICDIVAL